jgi:hypothetical protein
LKDREGKHEEGRAAILEEILTRGLAFLAILEKKMEPGCDACLIC